jgi:hypothetical protein
MKMVIRRVNEFVKGIVRPEKRGVEEGFNGTVMISFTIVSVF